MDMSNVNVGISVIRFPKPPSFSIRPYDYIEPYYFMNPPPPDFAMSSSLYMDDPVETVNETTRSQPLCRIQMVF